MYNNKHNVNFMKILRTNYWAKSEFMKYELTKSISR